MIKPSITRRTIIMSTAILISLIAIAGLSSSLSVREEQDILNNSPVTKVRDRLWIFTVHEGANNDYLEEGNFRGGSRMTPAEGAFWLDVPNLLFIRHKFPELPSLQDWRAKTDFEQYAISFQPLDRVVWSVVGSGGSGGLNELQPALDLARKFPNICGIFLDDFVRPAKKPTEGRNMSQILLEINELNQIREQMKTVGRPMELWVTLYTHDINPERNVTSPKFRECDPPLASWLDKFDVLTLWTWNSDEILSLEANLSALEKIAPKNSRIALGLYIWDFYNNKPVSVELMEYQCELGLKWLQEGRVHDIIFLANTLLDTGIPSAEFSREWIRKAGNQELKH